MRLYLAVFFISFVIMPFYSWAEETSLSEINKRIEQKKQYQSYEDWNKAFQKTNPLSRVLDEEETKNLLQKNKKKDITSFSFLIKNKTGWRQYNQDHFIHDMDQIKIDALEPSHRIIVKDILLFEGEEPSFFDSEQSFARYRIQKLIDLGFAKDATNLYAYHRQSDSFLSTDFIEIGIQAFLLSNQFDPACLELKTQENKKIFVQNPSLKKQLEALCDSHLNNNETKTPLSLSLEDLNKNEKGSLLTSFAIALAEHNKITLSIDGFSFQDLPLTTICGLLTNSLVPQAIKLKLLPKALRYGLLTEHDLEDLLSSSPTLQKIANQTYFQDFKQAASTEQKIKAAKAQIIINQSMISPESRLYLREISVLQPDESLKALAPFVYAYLKLNGLPHKAELWETMVFAQLDYAKTKEIQPFKLKEETFFIFPLYEWVSIMLKHIVVDDNGRFESYEKVLQKLEKLIIEDNLKTIYTEAFDTIDWGINQEIAKRLKRAVMNDDDLQALLTSVVLDLKNRETTTNDMMWINRPEKRIFILSGLLKADYRDYVLLLGHDLF